MRRSDAEERAEGGMSGAASVEAEDELVEVGLEVFVTQAVIDAEPPCCMYLVAWIRQESSKIRHL